MNEQLQEELQIIDDEGLLRRMRTIASTPGRTVTIDGKEYLNFSSNNYLGLSAHPDVKKAAMEATQTYGCGGTSSRLVAGTLELHRALEQKLAELKKAEAALVFSSGYQANVGIISSLVTNGDCVIMDRLNHASLWDGAKLSGARVFVYGHRDVDELEKLLQRSRDYRRKLIVTESLFSMDGDIAPLAEIVAIAKRYNASLMVDEAHATGVFGNRGSGLVEQCGVEGNVDVVMGTLSKALGSQGGFICGAKSLIDYLINKSRSFIYSTSLAPGSCAAALAAIDIVHREPERRQRVLTLSDNLRSRLTAIGFNTLDSKSQIIPFVVGPSAETTSLSAKLWREGIYAPAIRPPTVPKDQCRLRFSVTADHSEADIETLIQNIVSERSPSCWSLGSPRDELLK